ncbi:PREDICTED: expansin-B15-like [Ipomoea nil]|uniref:expansin-B15-like n=1 Tax=Ipomoea nil TaxID=35883 RepID=UPI000901BF70|nr:PREDICTED: expansin-B15-like [Ipomoea nil]
MPHFITYFLLFSTLAISCSCINHKNFTQSDPDWSPAGATKYGEPNGVGITGGACGYASSVVQPPFSSLVSAGGPSLFKSGKGCGACYEVKCTENAACSGNPVTIVITDSCPGGCESQPVHFDMSDTAFVAMAIPGNANQLRTAGVLNVQYRRVECNYPGVALSFGVRPGSSPYYFETLIEYVNGDGTLSTVELKQASASPDSWLSMQQFWGAVWKLQDTSGLTAPFSLRLTDESGNTLVADNVIPADWQPGHTYQSAVTSFV